MNKHLKTKKKEKNDMNIWHDIAPSRVKPEDFWAVIEIEKGSKNKYELDKETGMLRLDRILYTPRTTPRTTASSPARGPRTVTRWTCWYCAARASAR